VLSWDNPTTKGTFHVIPDLTVAWNDPLVGEVEALHDVPRNKTFVSGAPTFDFWFAMSPSSDFKGFAERVGIDRFKPFVLYLCSSNYIAANEHLFVSEFARTLKENPKTKDIGVVVRPHPLNASIWHNQETQDMVIWPRAGEWVDSPQAKQDYFDTIFHSQAVVAVNTSAFLEAAILDKPCITVMTDDSKSKQAGLGHFQHLMNGGFLEIATSYSEAATLVADIFIGRDSKQAQRQRFVREFIRPRGIHRPASQILADVIEALGSGSALPTFP
jgi:CDP-glycerol glycerophosphotransferase (TagB/SpsB family)